MYTSESLGDAVVRLLFTWTGVELRCVEDVGVEGAVEDGCWGWSEYLGAAEFVAVDVCS